VSRPRRSLVFTGRSIQEQLYEGRDLALTTDFRDVFAEITAHHLGASNLRMIFPHFQPNVANFRGFIRT
jgi:uncharacterized protein (DUF1501 family)